ncbi:putative uncharacterized protein [Parachlamydia acanthamoebae UV-7]|uniref:BclA C-terminal domain-containing protein n=2 Tax=Parachlamydia acanthamoebae TaxID=83552 RepID=F8L1X3_PARAV|nr:hypothetical protein [Parachlamydia acanthamoebae]KIA77018.1 hypothetical protein DB43_GY00030 [Parachlamydia acanthamoebae]CCB87287.1 putative uncharacterized protein [Parachlamydia acanthamoebae UV-7]
MKTWIKFTGCAFTSWMLLVQPLMSANNLADLTDAQGEAIAHTSFHFSGPSNAPGMIPFNSRSVTIVEEDEVFGVITITQSGDYLIEFEGISHVSTDFTFQLKINDAVFDLPVTISNVQAYSQTVSATTSQLLNAGDQISIITDLIFYEANLTVTRQ